MKPNQRPRRRASYPRGFALIVTLSLMILLTVIAVGLLTLSSISLRSSSQGNAMATARANARLAMMIALGDLQKHAGPDQRVSARADILDENVANPRLTGIWDSWEIKPDSQPTDFEKSARDAKFRGWLVSGSPVESKNLDFASKAPPSLTSVANKSPLGVTLWGKGTLGDPPFAKSVVSVGKIPLSASQGALAWAVMDEGVKVRIDGSYNDTVTSVSQKVAQLGSGQSPNVASMPGADPKTESTARPLDKLSREFFEKDSVEFAKLRNGVTRANFSLAADQVSAGIGAKLKPLTHDITVSSVGLFTDTARGGLKQDFQLLTNSAVLPATYASMGIYASRGVTKAQELSDPTWASLQQFARLYKDTTRLTSNAGVPVLNAGAPSGWVASSKSGSPPVTTVNRKPPPGVVLMPTVAKVQLVFSLAGRDIYEYPWNDSFGVPPPPPATKTNLHGPLDEHFKGTNYHYDLHLLYTPVITLHNPYTVALEFTEMKFDFVRVPFAMQVFRNGQAQSRGMVPLETMYGDNFTGSRDKPFSMALKASTPSQTPGAVTTPIRLLPGEVKMFSAYVPKTSNYNYEVRRYFASDNASWDANFNAQIRKKIDALQGWRGDGLGFAADQLAGNLAIDAIPTNGRWKSSIAFDRDDQIHVEFAPLSTPEARNKFIVQMSAKVGTLQTVVNTIEVDFESPTGLQDTILGKNNKLRFPKDPSETINAIDLVGHSRVPYGSLAQTKPFALLSLQAKSTSGMRDGEIVDGRNAAKPWAFAHANIGASSQKVLSEHPANHSHEIDLQVLSNGTLDLFDTDPQGRTNFVTGHRIYNGSKFGAQYEIPLAPLQALPALNSANPGGSSGYLPRFAQPIGNSWAHPLMSPDKMQQSAAGANYLDHSFLLNLALYDGFYFSGLASQDGPFGSGLKTETLAAEFAAGRLLSDRRMSFHRPNGSPVADFTAEVPKDTAYAKVAAWQLMNGAFNINSTSVAAWKAMLGSIRDGKAMYNQISKGAPTVPGTSKLADLSATAAGESRISRFRLPSALSAKSDPSVSDGYWLGPREYDDAEMQLLAENIVKQVRLRGPFLSMADFVNRRLGSESDKKAQCGALQQAIDESEVNQKFVKSTGVNAGYEIPSGVVAGYKYANKTAGAGLSYQGAPGFLTQADLLTVLGNAATARSDTFTIRGYGEARDAAGKITASATCEVVVQRYPEWVDRADAVETLPAALTSQANRTFGRRFAINSFRWLASSEV